MHDLWDSDIWMHVFKERHFNEEIGRFHVMIEMEGLKKRAHLCRFFLPGLKFIAVSSEDMSSFCCQPVDIFWIAFLAIEGSTFHILPVMQFLEMLPDSLDRARTKQEPAYL